MSIAPPSRCALYILTPALIGVEQRSAFDVELPALAAAHGALRCERLEISSGSDDLDRQVLIALALSHAQLVVTPSLEHLGGYTALIRVSADIYTADHLVLPASGSWAAALATPPHAPVRDQPPPPAQGERVRWLHGVHDSG